MKTQKAATAPKAGKARAAARTMPEAKAPATAMLIARLPSELLARLEATARQCGRSRSAEARIRLQESLTRMPAMATAEHVQG